VGGFFLFWVEGLRSKVKGRKSKVKGLRSKAASPKSSPKGKDLMNGPLLNPPQREGLWVK
jgi:hypothetical protein